LDISPTFSINAPTSLWGASATALPGVVLEDPRWNMLDREDILREELMHGKQQRALGPGFWPAYALTAGHPFEPYLGGSSTMWMPNESIAETFPIFRIRREGGRVKANFMPGYPVVGR